MYELRKVKSDEVDEALSLALETFMEFEAPDYKPEGAETFRALLSDENFIQGYKRGICPMYAAFDNGKIIGLIGMRENKTHINLVFVKKEYHRKGIATEIFGFLLEDLRREKPELSEITLNSSPYGLPFYLHLGFIPQSEELEKDGIRYTPMKFGVKGDNNGI